MFPITRWGIVRLWCVLSMLLMAHVGKTSGEVSHTQFCDIAAIEIRYRDYFVDYLSAEFNSTNPNQTRPHGEGKVYKQILKACKTCCPKAKVSFIWLDNVNMANQPIQVQIQKEQLNEMVGHTTTMKDKVVLYFPEFSGKGALEVYAPSSPFLPVVKSPGHVVLMRAADVNTGLDPMSILSPSWPLLASQFICAFIFGAIVWFLDHWKNSEQFSPHFIIGVFDGFWWAVVTMTTVGYGDKAPKSFLAQLLTMFWMIASFINFSLIAANTTSIVTTQRIAKIERTIGLKIGVLNSRQYVESETTLGAEIIEYHNTSALLTALHREEVDRILFPHYMHYLAITSRNDNYMKDVTVAKMLDHAFQVGLVFAHPVNKTKQHHLLKLCFTNVMLLPLEFNSSIKEEELMSNTMDTTQVILGLRVFVILLVALVVLGLAWDLVRFLKTWKKRWTLKNI